MRAFCLFDFFFLFNTCDYMETNAKKSVYDADIIFNIHVDRFMSFVYHT